MATNVQGGLLRVAAILTVVYVLGAIAFLAYVGVTRLKIISALGLILAGPLFFWLAYFLFVWISAGFKASHRAKLSTEGPLSQAQKGTPGVRTKRFRVAFSFTGEKRNYVAKVAAMLAARFGEAAILYDKFHAAEFARRDLGFYLPNLYHEEADLVIVVVCLDYEGKEWCGLEWDAIFDLLKKRKNEEVMLCRFDRALVKGLYSTAGFLDLDDLTPAETTTCILERLALNEGKPKEYYFSDTSVERPGGE